MRPSRIAHCLVLLGVFLSVLPGSAFARFVIGQTLQVGKGPDGVAIGDFNGDGIPDLAVTIQGSITVNIFSGVGDGTFQSGPVYPIGALPTSVTTADLNGDGKLDLVTANGSDISVQGNISVLLGNGDGTFQPAVNYDAGSLPSSVAIADYNGDGKLDLAVADESEISGNEVSVLLGVGDGTFKPATPYPTGTSPNSVVAGDFNHDGKVDLATANYLDNSVSVLLGNGDGTFKNSVQYHVTERPIQIVTADFNGDGIPDLAVAVFNAFGVIGHVALLRGIGDGTFFNAAIYRFQKNVYSIAVGLLNEDSLPDLVLGHAGGITPLLNLGGGKFAKGGRYGSQGIPLAVAVGDLTGNGLVDIVEADYVHNSIVIFLNTGS